MGELSKWRGTVKRCSGQILLCKNQREMRGTSRVLLLLQGIVWGQIWLLWDYHGNISMLSPSLISDSFALHCFSRFWVQAVARTLNPTSSLVINNSLQCKWLWCMTFAIGYRTIVISATKLPQFISSQHINAQLILSTNSWKYARLM